MLCRQLPGYVDESHRVNRGNQSDWLYRKKRRNDRGRHAAHSRYTRHRRMAVRDRNDPLSIRGIIDPSGTDNDGADLLGSGTNDLSGKPWFEARVDAFSAPFQASKYGNLGPVTPDDRWCSGQQQVFDQFSAQAGRSDSARM